MEIETGAGKGGVMIKETSLLEGMNGTCAKEEGKAREKREGRLCLHLSPFFHFPAKMFSFTFYPFPFPLSHEFFDKIS